MERRVFLKAAAAAIVAKPWVMRAAGESLDLRGSEILLPTAAGARERKSAQVLQEEAEKRCGIRWQISDKQKSRSNVAISLATRRPTSRVAHGSPSAGQSMNHLSSDGYSLTSGTSGGQSLISVTGGSDRGLLFGVGKLLRELDFGRQSVSLPSTPLRIVSEPEYKLRGHQLGYRPKTNAYDAWSAAMWDQYIRELAIFGTNAIEIIPPVSDDLPDSPHFPLPPQQMMVEMSRIADSYDLDVWIWYPAMERDYSDAATVQKELVRSEKIFSALPRVNAVMVPGGDPGHTEPKYLLALLQRQKEVLRRSHPAAQIWVSPQGFSTAWTQQFLSLVREPATQQWLDGIVFGPMSRLPEAELLRALPRKYPIRCYPDITHSVQCQYPVPNWDVAYALTEGREPINPRPRQEANILRRILPGTVGFITYSEGCNDDVNKFIWSALGWSSGTPVEEALRDFTHFFAGGEVGEGYALGLMHLESNWRGALATNVGVDVTLERFRQMERSCSPAVLENWRFQQALYRAYFDAYVRARLLAESAALERARGHLEEMLTIGWGAVPLHIGGPPATSPPNGLTPDLWLDAAQSTLAQALTDPAGNELRTRVRELGEALFQSIHMQLAVERYQGEAVNRGANLDTLQAPVTDVPWLHRSIAEIRRTADPMSQLAAVRALLNRRDPGPGGFYDALGDPAARPHLQPGPGWRQDPDFRTSVLTGFDYPDIRQDRAPIAWKCWGETLYDTPLVMEYDGLNRGLTYRLRVVYSGDAPHIKLRLMANDRLEVHPYILRSWPPAPQEFALPREATKGGKLKLAWNREPGLGGNGRGCQVSEVWLMVDEVKKPD